MRWYNGRMPLLPRHCEGGPKIFTLYWLGGMFSPSMQGEVRVAFKAAIAGVLALVASVTEAIAVAITVLLLLWMLDMLFGLAKTMRDPKRRFRGDKFGDGILKLIVVVCIPAIIVAMEVAFLEEVWGLRTGGKVGLVVAAFLGTDLLFSILDSIAEFWSVAEKIRAVIIRYREGAPGEPGEVEEVEEDAVVTIRRRKRRNPDDPKTPDG